METLLIREHRITMMSALDTCTVMKWCAILPSLQLHAIRPAPRVGTLNMVVTATAVRGIGKVGTLAAILGGSFADSEVLRHAHQHELLGVVQRECHAS